MSPKVWTACVVEPRAPAVSLYQPSHQRVLSSPLPSLTQAPSLSNHAPFLLPQHVRRRPHPLHSTQLLSLRHREDHPLTSFLRHRTATYTEIDIARSQYKDTWWEKYQNDVPVLHVERVEYTYAKKDKVNLVGVLMHRFREEDGGSLVDLAEGEGS